MPALGGSAGTAPSGGGGKKKPPKPTGSGSLTAGALAGAYAPPPSAVPSQYTTPVSSQPSYAPPPSYVDSPSSHPTQPKPKKQRRQRKREKQEDQESLEALRYILEGNTLKNREGSAWESHFKQVTPEYIKKLAERQPDEPKGDDKVANLQSFLQNIENPKAPEGYLPPVPERFKQRKNGQLKRHWDEEFIQARIEDFDGERWRVEKFLNDNLEAQLNDREEWLQGRNKRQVNQVWEVLKDAKQAAFEGDYTYLEDELKKNPDLFEVPTYRSMFGITADQVWENWFRRRGSLNKEDRTAQSYRVEVLADHLEAMQHGNKYAKYSFARTRKKVHEAIKWYEDAFNESVEFGLNSSDEERKAAAQEAKGKPTIPDFSPPTSKTDQAIYDEVGDRNDPRSDSDILELLGGTNRTRKRIRKADSKEVQQAREDAKLKLGLKKLPRVRDMLAVMVQEGNLDPDNRQQVAQWVERFKNPNHPDTRAMYAAWAMRENKHLSDDAVLQYVNENTEEYFHDLAERRQSNIDAENAAQRKEADQFVPETASDIAALAAQNNQEAITRNDEQAANATETNVVGWTLDKLSRLNYGVAGMFDAWYSMDKEPTKSWTGNEGALGSIVTFAVDPMSMFTGKSWIDSVDDVVANPSGLLDVGREGYSQVFRGSGLPGVRDDIVPTTFSQVIANNAARDGEGDLYDKEWFQHLSGFALDVGTDPLNLIGVGIVDDTIKLPSRLAKGTKADSNEVSVPADIFLTKLEDASPVVEKVVRTDQAIRRIGDEGVAPYVEDTELFPVDLGVQYRQFGDEDISTLPAYREFTDTSAVRAEISKQMKELKVQEAKLLNDTGVQQMVDELDSINDELGKVVFDKPTDLRVQRVLARTSTTIHDTKYLNPGGKFWRDFIKPAEDYAKRQGMFDIEYAPGTIGQAAAKAQQQLDKIQEAVDAGKLHASDPAVASQIDHLDSIIRQGYEIDEATGAPAISHKPRFKEFLDAGMPGMPRTGFDPTRAFAEAMGVSKEDFTRIFPERLVHEALLFGRDLYIKSDPAAAAQFSEATSRINESKRQLEALRQGQGPKAAAKREATYRALSIGYKQMSELTIAGALRVLDEWQNMQRTARSGFSDPTLARHLEGLDEAIEAELSKAIPSADVHTPDFINGTFEDFDFAGASLADIVAHNPDQFKDRAAQLQAAQVEIRSQIENLRLSASREITGLPSAVAHKVDQLLPPNSQFRKNDGSIDIAKVREQFKFDPKHPSFYSYHKAADPGDNAFLSVVRDTLEAEYRGAYRAVKSKELGHPKPKGEVVGERTRKLGPRPTFESLRQQRPTHYKSHHMRDESTKDVKFVEHVVEQGGAKGVPAKQVRETSVVKGGKRTKRQLSWEQYVAREQRKWDKAYARAAELDLADARNREVDVSFKQTQQEVDVFAQKANKQVMDGVLKSIAEKGEIKQVPSNVRLTINEQARDVKRRVSLELQYKEAQLRLRELEAQTPGELAQIKAAKAALNTQRRNLYRKIETARVQAIATRKVMSRRIGEEHVLQVINMPTRVTGSMVQLRLLGMRKNLQFSNNLFRGVEQISHLIPAKARENFANVFVRPTKQLDTREAVYFRAVWESQTPVIIKAHLSRLSARMKDIPENERVSMMRAYRNGSDYEGPSAGHYQGVKDELNELEDIWNEKHDLYRFKDPKRADGAYGLGWYELSKFLPVEYTPNLKVLQRAVGQKNGEVTIDDLIEAIKANEYSTPKDLFDPFRFSWTMRLAADQARQYEALRHMIKHTFGVQRRNLNAEGKVLKHDPKSRVIEKLHTKYGWQTVPKLGMDTYFPPEAIHDINKLFEFMEPGGSHNAITKLFDNAIGYWKQGMTIYNPGYYTRNGIGEIMASWFDGVNHPKWYRMAHRVSKFAKNEDANLAELIKKWSLDGVIHADPAKGSEVLFKLKGGQKVTVEDAMREYIRMGLKSTFANTDIDQGVRGLAGAALTDSKIRKGLRKVNTKVHDVGEGFEDYLRMAHFLHAMQHSGKGSMGDAALYAAERVRKYHFDYTDFSTFEKAVMLRAFPFYKWTRRGAPLMLAHLFMTPGKMAVLPKAMDTMSGLGLNPIGAFTDDPVLSTKDVHDDQNGHLPDYTGIAPAWVRDLFAYEMNPPEDDEYGNYFRIQTPQIDGLNALASFVPGQEGNSGNGVMGFLGDSAGYPLLNPAIKMPIELGMNKSMDPDFPYEVYGGEYNEMNQLSPADSIGIYAARNLNPLLGFLAKLSKNEALGPLSVGDGSYRHERGYDSEYDVGSFATGLGFYQARAGKEPIPPSSSDPQAVGLYELGELPVLNGAPAAPGTRNKQTDAAKAIEAILEASGGPYKDSGFKWRNFKWRDFGNNWRDFDWRNFNYGGGGYGSSSYVGSSGVSMEFWELLQRLKAMVDQGEVLDD